MELQFTQNGNQWIAETTVNAPYHLHLERKGDKSKFMIYQRGTHIGSRLCFIPATARSAAES